MNTSGVTNVTRMMSGVNNYGNNHSSNCSSNNNNSSNSTSNNSNKNMNNNNNNNFTMNLHINKMHSLDYHDAAAAGSARATTTISSPTSSPPDFDFNIPCRYFKSSFARSLSLNNASNHCKSLDYEPRSNGSNNDSDNINKQHIAGKILQQRTSRASTPATASAAAAANVGVGNDSSDSNMRAQNEVSSKHSNNKAPEIPARRLTMMTYNLELPQNLQPQEQQQPLQQHVPLTQLRPQSVATAVNSHAATAHFNKIINQQQQQQHVVVNHHHNNNSNVVNIHSSTNSNNNNRRNIVWPRDSVAGEQDFELSDEAAELEMTKISNADYMLTTDQQQAHLQQHHRPTFEPHEDTVNVEAVLLQNQVDTLQWQLKQVETSCVMYRAVMEEVARFLDRYHSQRRQQQLLNRNNNLEQITRSKSMYHVYGGAEEGGGYDDDCDAAHVKATDCSYEQPPAGYLRTRSSTNLVDMKQSPPTPTKITPKKIKLPKGSVDDQLYDVIAPAKNYNAFKDYTWRRSPKKLQEARAHANATDVEDKLNQEAFRLSRTIHNLLNTSMQQPDLTQHRNSLAAVSMGRLSKTPATASIMTLHQPLLNSTSLSLATGGTELCGATNPAALPKSEMLFLRSMNMRDSRLSLRSSTDSSVHSTSSSSKLETDEEHSPFSSAPHMHASAPKLIPQLCSTTEDESGFSSISSFQDIGVPLSSTMISTRNSVKAQEDGVQDFHVDSRNSTLKAVAPPPPPTPTTTHPTNVVGVPLNATPDMQHRWDSPSKTYSSAPNKFQQRFSTLSNDDSTTVLWV